ncbi:MAG: pyridoxamine 5'-phosphate oxidase [Rhodospirillales bacterium]|nr:pyridoxamine 5'-phosphate oxidase [Rhodospirillales bacterium]
MSQKDPEDPIALFQSWFAEATRAEPSDANAVTLATVDAAGRPSARMVLLKDVDARGFVFYTNRESRKGLELLANPRAALCFFWKSLDRQVRVEGPVEPVADSEADGYFATRDRASQIGAWASSQSRPLESRFALERRIAEFTAKFHVGTVPRPPFWSGFRLVPEAIEFWQERPFRLHDRTVYHRAGSAWSARKLYP